MELHTQQYQSPSFNDTPLEEFFHSHHQLRNMFGDHNNLNGAVFSTQESELTSNMSGSRKRNRQQDDYRFPKPQQMLHYRHPSYVSQQIIPSKMAKVGQVSAETVTTSISSGLQQSYEVNRLNGSEGMSTSGQPCLVSPFVSSTHSQDLDSYLLLQNLEIEALIQQQNEKLQSDLQETRKRHCRSLASVLEQQILKWLQEKERELADANSRNAQLEEKLTQMSAENQILFNTAMNNEAMVSSLKSGLEQIILSNQNQNQIKEGFGDSDEDAQSSCNQEAE